MCNKNTKVSHICMSGVNVFVRPFFYKASKVYQKLKFEATQLNKEKLTVDTFVVQSVYEEEKTERKKTVCYRGVYERIQPYR